MAMWEMKRKYWGTWVVMLVGLSLSVWACSSHLPTTAAEADPGDVKKAGELVGPGGDLDLSELPEFDWIARDGLAPDSFALCAGPGHFSCQCDSNDDCSSGWCVFHMGGKVCTETCVTKCPEGWSCNPAPGPDPCSARRIPPPTGVHCRTAG